MNTAIHSALKMITMRQINTKDSELLISNRRIVNINDLISGVVYTLFQYSSTYVSISMNESRPRSNSHVDTSVVGMNCLISHDNDKRVNTTYYDSTQCIIKNLQVVSVDLVSHG